MADPALSGVRKQRVSIATSSKTASPACLGCLTPQILSASLSTFENDLHASNMVGMPLLFKYGKEDDNVPTWHSRSMAALVSAWNAQSGVNASTDALLSVSEVAKRGHWWDNIIKEEDVQAQIEETLGTRRPALRSFTLTSANPDETGSLQGFRIVELESPGR